MPTLNPIDLLWGFLLLGIVEAIVKPIATHFVDRGTQEILEVFPELFQKLDPIMPAAIRDLSAEELRAIVTQGYCELKGKEMIQASERDRMLALFEETYSVFVNADRLQSVVDGDREVG